MKLKTISTMFFSLLFLLSNAKVQGQELRKEGRYYIAEVNKTFKVKEGGTLKMFDIRGDVDVETWTNKQVQIHEIKKMDVYTEAEARAALARAKSGYKKRDNVIEVDGGAFSRNWIKSRFEIRVPKLFNLDIETRAGDLSVNGVAGAVRLNTSGGEIILTDIGGEVDARTSGGDIEVNNSQKAVTLKTSGGEIKLRNIGGPLDAKTSGGDITLRGSEDRVNISTSGGEIRILDAGGRVKARTSGGDIEIENTKGVVKVHTSGGDIDLSKIGGALEASTSGGDIGGSSIQGGAVVSTSGGSINLKNVRGGVQGKTAGGDIQVEITLQNFTVDHRVDLRTASGEIVLYIPEKLPATIRAEIRITDRWEDYHIYSDFPLTSSEEEENKEHYRRHTIASKGDINGGGDLIELSTTNGDIHIKKLRKYFK